MIWREFGVMAKLNSGIALRNNTKRVLLFFSVWSSKLYFNITKNCKCLDLITTWLIWYDSCLYVLSVQILLSSLKLLYLHTSQLLRSDDVPSYCTPFDCGFFFTILSVAYVSLDIRNVSDKSYMTYILNK